MEVLLLQIIAGLLGALIVLVGWLGTRLFTKVDTLIESMHEHELKDSHKFDLHTGEIAMIKHRLSL